jgi:hypothetical protein
MKVHVYLKHAVGCTLLVSCLSIGAVVIAQQPTPEQQKYINR